ncbi:MAG: hypothetical protein ABIC57_02535 [bacterium]
MEGLSEARSDELINSIPEIYSPVAKAVVETTKDAILINNIDNPKIVILGKSRLLGHPVKMVLSKLYQDVEMLDSKSSNELEILKSSDVIISGIGKSDFIKANMIKQGVITIDAGFEVDEKGKIHGDFDPDVINKVSFFTPVPGGIGPLTVAYIFDNLLRL